MIIVLLASEWASSGARLGLKLDLQISDGCTCSEYNQEALFGGGSGGVLPPSLLSAVPLNEPSFTSKHGIETVKVTQGALSIQEQNADSKMYSFRFCLDFVSDVLSMCKMIKPSIF